MVKTTSRVTVLFLTLASTGLTSRAEFDIVATIDSPVPGSIGNFSFLYDPIIADDGSVAFGAALSGTAAGFDDNHGLYLARPDQPLSKVAQEGDPNRDELGAVDPNGQLGGAGNGASYRPFTNYFFSPTGELYLIDRLTDTIGAINDDNALFVRSSDDVLRRVLQENDDTPDGTAEFTGQVGAAIVGKSGQLAFLPGLRDVTDASSVRVYHYDGQSLTRIAGEGDTVPESALELDCFSCQSGEFYRLTDNGEVWFSAALDFSFTDPFRHHVYSHDGIELSRQLGEGDTVAGAPTPLASIDYVYGSRNGAIAIEGQYDRFGPTAIFVNNGSTTDLVVEEGQEPPEQNGTYEAGAGGFGSSFQDDIIGVSHAGDIAFSARIEDSDLGGADDEGLYYYSRASDEITTLVREGSPPPDGNGIFDGGFVGLSEPISPKQHHLGEDGTLVFAADLRITSGGDDDNEAVYYYDGTLRKVVREGELAPRGDASVRTIYGFAGNDRGDVLISVAVEPLGGAPIETALLFYDGSLLTEVLRTGDTIEGTVISGIDTQLFAAGSPGAPDHFGDSDGPLNNNGEFAIGAFSPGGPFGGLGDQLILRYSPDVTIPPGDANGDGTVDLLDLDILGQNFGSQDATLNQGDFNGDGVVDLLDLDILGENFSDASITIPEPTAVTLLVPLCFAVRRL